MKTDTSEGSAKPTNREIGQLWMSKVLADLYEGWPARYNINPIEVAVETGVIAADEGLDHEQLELWMGLINWLTVEGIITVGGFSIQGDVRAAQLTGKGFEALEKSAPGAPEKTIVSRMGDLTKSGSKAIVGEAAKEVGKRTGKELAEVFGAYVGAIGKTFSGP